MSGERLPDLDVHRKTTAASVLGVSVEELEAGDTTTHNLADPEVTELFEQFLELDDAQRDAVKLVLRDLLALRRLEATFQRRAAS